MDFRPMAPEQRTALRNALRGNASDENGGLALLMGRDTAFRGTSPDVDDETNVIDRIKSMPCHY